MKYYYNQVQQDITKKYKFTSRFKKSDIKHILPTRTEEVVPTKEPLELSYT